MTGFSIGTGEQNLAENENFKNELKHILWRWLDRLNVVGDGDTSIEKDEVQ